MASTTPPVPYGPLSAQVWQSSYQSLQWLQSVVGAAGASGNAQSLGTQANLVVDTLANGVDLLDGSAISAALAQDVAGLRLIAALPIPYTTDQANAINNRITGMIVLGEALLAPIPTVLPTAVAGLNAGGPGIPAPDYLTTFLGWNAETAPVELVSSRGLLGVASAYAGNWSAIVTGAAGFYGAFPQPALDSAVRVAQGALLTNQILSQLFASGGPVLTDYASLQQLWNITMALPATLASANLLRPDVSLDSSQQNMATRAFLITMAEQVAAFSLICRGWASTATTTGAASVLSVQNQGLMDIAAQNLSSFEAWGQLRGGLNPPWGAGAVPPGTLIPLVSGSTALTQAQILGTDISIGAQNSPLPAWTGDLPIVVGIPNYRAALARRLSTSLGSLVYHQNYGSRIPPELGQVLTTGAQALITAFGRSALLGDPRTQSVISAQTAMLSGQPNAVFFSGTVQPIGPGVPPVGVSEVVSPSRAA